MADRISGKKGGINTKLIPSCIYTKPEIACVGKTEDDLKKENIPYNVGKFPLSGNGKALSMGEPEGFVKILTGKTYGEILGAHIVGARATDLLENWHLQLMQNVRQKKLFILYIRIRPYRKQSLKQQSCPLTDRQFISFERMTAYDLSGKP